MPVVEASAEAQVERNEELPDYATVTEPHKHLSSLFNRNGQPWMTLLLLSEAPAGNKSPVYYDGGTVRGSVQLNLESPQTIRSVVVEVQSKLRLAAAQDVPPFWDEKRTIWNNSGNYEPKSIATAGRWRWDFSFPIPRHFDNSVNGGHSHTVLPSNFNLKPFSAFVEHRVLLFVKRGKYMSNLSEIHTLFSYVVRERAPPPSSLREQAYTQQRSPPSPSADPGGWKAGDVINAKGILFGDREVDLVYRPYLANPTVYPRGGTVFYRIEIWGNDLQGLDLLASQSSITVLLTQEVECRPTAGEPSRAMAIKAATQVDLRAIAQGVSWSAASSPEEDLGGVRILEGEISIPQRLNSNVNVALLQLSYSVIFVVNAAGFVPRNRNNVIARHPVRIVSHPAIGIKPVSRMPPGYEPKVTYRETDVEWALSAIRARMMGSARAKGGNLDNSGFV